MKWPWQTEKRQSGGGFSDAVIRQIEAQAAEKATDAGTTAAVEAAAGALSRAFMAARVEAVDWAVAAVSPDFLALTARNLVRAGASMHSIELDAMGRPWLAPIAFWNWESFAHTGHPGDKRNWHVRATSYGPSSSHTKLIPWDGVIWSVWGSSPGTTYVGAGPLGFASTTARLMAETERSMADEAGGPIVPLIPHVSDGGDGDDEDRLAQLKADIRNARGRALLVETLAAGQGEGRASAPQKDWVPNRLGPNMPDAMVELARDAFMRVLSATGTPPPLFLDSDGTSQREALRRYHMGTVLPIAVLLEHQLTEKLETPVRLKFDNYALDLAGRAQAFKAMVANGVEIEKALGITGLMSDDD